MRLNKYITVKEFRCNICIDNTKNIYGLGEVKLGY